jgi:hypothetical protein
MKYLKGNRIESKEIESKGKKQYKRKFRVYSKMASRHSQTQNELLLTNLLDFYKKDNNMERLMKIINGESSISLRIIDWFVTNFAKKNFTVYSIPAKNRCSTVINGEENMERFKVFHNYKLELKAYSKVRFDPFSRRERIMIPYKDDTCLQTTIGQLNFFKWAIENQVLEYIEKNYDEIEADMNSRNSISKKNTDEGETDNKTRKKREELSISACKTIKKEMVKIVVKF